MDIITTSQLKEKALPMENVQFRLPKAIRDQAKAIAKKQSNSRKVKEVDIYRTAIVKFLAEISTDGRNEKGA